MSGGARARGFTLVEALVALVILAIVAVLAYRGTASLTVGEAQLAAESARWRTLDAVFTRLEADLRQALPRPVRHGDQFGLGRMAPRDGERPQDDSRPSN